MLTLVYNATEGDDDVIVDGQAARTSIIGPTYDVTFDHDIVVNLFGGNDRVHVEHLFTGTTLTIRGGTGDDFVTVAEGHFAQ